MRIIFINRFFYPDSSATSQMLTDLAFWMAGKGYEIHVLTSRQLYEDPKACLPKYSVEKNVYIHRISTTSFGRANLATRVWDYLTFYWGALFFLLAFLKRQDIVVAKTDPPLISFVTMIAAKLRGATQVNWIQDLFPEVAQALGVSRVASGILFNFLKKIRNQSLKFAKTNVVISEAMASKLALEGIKEKNIQLIHNWCDQSIVYPISKKDNEFCREWGLLDKFVIAYSGNMGRAHELVMLAYIAEALKQDTRFIFLFIGGGWQKEIVEAEFKKRALTNFMFKPVQEKKVLAKSLGVADIHVVSLKPSLEGLIFPSKFYGILAAAKPVFFIGAPNSEMAKILKVNECGFSFSSDQVLEASQKLKELAQDYQQLILYGLKARQLFENSYESKIAFAKWSKVF